MFGLEVFSFGHPLLRPHSPLTRRGCLNHAYGPEKCTAPVLAKALSELQHEIKIW